MKQLIQLTLLLIALLLPIAASANEIVYDFNMDGIYYKITDSNTHTVKVTYQYISWNGSTYDDPYSNYSGSVSIPTTVTYNGTIYSVTEISDYAFYHCSGLRSVVIPNSVTYIGDYAFIECTGLASIEIPNSVTYIGKYAFYGTAWYDNQPDGLLYAGLVAYKYKGAMANGTIISIKAGTSAISGYAFSGCTGLTSVEIPNSVTSIGEGAFSGCVRLKEVYSYIKDPFHVLQNNAFYLNPNWRYALRTLYIPAGTINSYESSDWFNYFGSFVEMGEVVTAASIKLNKETAEIYVGMTLQLTATVLPEDATDKSVTWISSDSAVVTVDENGLVTAIAAGIATVTATTTDGSNLSDSCLVTVYSDMSEFGNYLSMADVSVFHGKTFVVHVKMTNDASIISFQTDIFLPEGLELVQEDGEYLIEPSERMTRTHSIMSNDVSNGAVRVVCYSSNYKPFTGNSGDDLFYFTVKVADDAGGNYCIQLGNTLFTTTDFEELSAPDVTANVNVLAYILGDANNSGTVTVTDVVVTSQYVLEMNPQPFIFEAADVNFDGNITVTDVSRIAWMVLNPTMNAPLRAPALWNNGDRMNGNDITLAIGETRKVSIALDNEMDYAAFQLDLKLPAGLMASNFQLTDRAGSHAFDVNTLQNGNIRALCYSPAMAAIDGHEGALLTFDVTATGDVQGDIIVDGIELVTTACQTVLFDTFAIGVNNATAVNELAAGKAVAKVEYFNLAGQQVDRPDRGVTLVVTTYTDGTRSTTKLIQR